MKFLAYILALVGLALIALNKTVIGLPILSGNTKATIYVVLAGIVLIVIGVVMIGSKAKSYSGKVPHASEEVPIYEGEGKNKRIIGYKKTK